jgi:FtsP/CotA-like multicopper oxidase with cupredoxin domain
VACHLEDTVTFFPMLGRYEIWQLINLTGDTHPIHIHLSPFQVLARRPITYAIPELGITDDTTAASATRRRDPRDEREDRDMMRPIVTMPHQLMPFRAWQQRGPDVKTRGSLGDAQRSLAEKARGKRLR